MSELGISLGVSPREPFDRFLSLMRQAEDSGVNAAWIIDSQIAMKDAYVALALAAKATDRLKLGPGVTNLVTRHETVLANAMNSLADVAPGRIMLGLGAGDSSVFPLGLHPSSIQDCSSGIQRLRSLMQGEAVPVGDQQVRLSFAPPEPPKIFFAGSQPRMLELAGRFGDGVIIMGPADPQTLRMQIEHVENGSAAAGRAPHSVFRDVWVTMSVGARDSVEDVKSWASAQARWLNTWKVIPESLRPYQGEMAAAAKQYDFSTHLARAASHAATVSDEFARRLAIAGPMDHCVDRLGGLLEAGVDRLTVTLLSGGRERRLEAIAEAWGKLLSGREAPESEAKIL